MAAIFVCPSPIPVVGMDEATLVRAVEPFFSTKGVGKGTGLWLVDGAWPWFPARRRPNHSKPIRRWNQYRALAACRDCARGIEGGLLLKIAPPPVMRETVLLVDDEDLVRASTAAMLTELGYEVTETDSAEQALRLMREGLRPNLLVTDHLMPGMSGVDLARIVRSQKPDTKILVVSGYAEAEGVAPDLPRLAKPFRSEDLAASLADLRSGRW